MSARKAVASRIRAADWPFGVVFAVSLAILLLESLGLDLDEVFSGLTGIRLAGPQNGVMATVRSIWQDIHHFVFSLSSVIILFRFQHVTGRTRAHASLDISILRWAAAYTLFVLAASGVLEWMGPRLDLLVTSILLTATVFAFILFLIIRSPALIRNSRGKYEGSRLSPGESAIILERITRLMEGEKAFKDPDFDLPTAAMRIGTSVPGLSQAVNQGLGKNFARMLSSYRVGEARRLLSESRLPVTDVAFEAGFGSLSSFNSIFKAECGLSPSEYREKLK
jgi:AraC-like DNA-binding protein